MQVILTDEYLASLIKLAETECQFDDLDDYCGGNIDVAFSVGETSGEICAVRSFLDALGIEYTINRSKN